MNDDVLYYLKTKTKFFGKSEILRQIREYEKKFRMSATKFHELFLEGDMNGKDAQDFSNILDLYIEIYGRIP